jgi:predicted ATPase
MREIQVQASLSHSHIAALHTALRIDNQLVMIMELLEGVTLDVRMSQSPLSIQDGLRYVCQVLEALRYAHLKGVVHRDIKPSNIMITPEDSVKLMDFGIARAASRGTFTSPGMAIGSAAYMAPEQVKGAAPDPRSDLYSVGVTLYEIATGQRPFQGENDYEIMTAHVRQEPRPPRELNASLAPAVAQVILKSLAKDPAARFQTAEEFRAALLALSDENPERREPARVFVPPPRRRMVGRQAELAEMASDFQSAASGAGRFTCIYGEPGIGKTALVETFIASLGMEQHPFALAQGRCSGRLSEAEPYRSVLEAFETLLAGPDGHLLKSILAQTAPGWFAQLQPGASESNPTSQERMVREATAFLLQASRTTPVILFLDDLHWADVSTVDLLLDLTSRLDGARILILGTFRPHEGRKSQNVLQQARLQLRRRGSYREIDLNFLGERDCQEYLALEFPGCEFPAEFGALVRRKTAGNPLFLVELVRFLKDKGFITRQGQEGGLRLARPIRDLETEAPESVRAMIQAKLDQLSDDERRLLLAASVQGMDFDSAVVARTLGQDAVEVEEGLDAAQNLRGIVNSVGESELPDGTLAVRYRFVQEPEYEAMYASLKPARRASMSAAAGEAMAMFHRKQIRPAAGQIALLFETARKFGQAAEYFRLASQHAAHLGASHEAIVLAKKGLALLDREPESADRDREELSLRMTLGGPLTLARFGSPEIRENYLRARELSAAQGDNAQLLPSLWGLWLSHLADATLPDARKLAEEILAMAEQDGAAARLVAAHWAMGTTLGNMGQIVTARSHFERGIALYDPRQHDDYTAVHGFDPGVACRVELGGRILWLLGFPDRALAMIREAQELARRLAHPPSVTFALTFEAVLRQLRGEPAACLERAAEVLGDERAPSNLRAWAMLCRGWGLVASGQFPPGLEEIERSLALHRSIGSPMGRPHFLGALADALGRAGNVAGALAALGEAFDLMKKTGQRYYEAELMRVSGELFSKSAQFETAERYFNEALSVARAQGAKSLELRTAMSLARFWRSRGKQKEAAALLAGVFAAFEEGFETADLSQAGALRQEIS